MNLKDRPLVPRIVFFQVRNAQEKLRCIIDTVTSHFTKKEKILLFVEDEKALHFVDELLWKTPPTSFLPHAIAEKEVQESVAVTKTKQNVNGAKIAFNLCPTPLFLEFPLIYELEDLTSLGKTQLSRLRFDQYKKNHCLIEAR